MPVIYGFVEPTGLASRDPYIWTVSLVNVGNHY